MRDSQRSKLYEAEGVLQNWPGAKSWGKSSVPAMQDYVDKLTNSAWWKRRGWESTFRGDHIEVRSGQGRRVAAALGDYAITLPLWARSEAVLLHEVAHIANVRKAQTFFFTEDRAAHGWEFAAIEVELVHHMMGKDAADALKKSFREHKVRYKKPQKRNLSPEQRQACRERLEVARAARGNVAAKEGT